MVLHVGAPPLPSITLGNQTIQFKAAQRMSDAQKELNARRRFKMLHREQQRLSEKGQADPIVDKELAALVAEFPVLADGAATKPLSAAASSLLAFGEAMSQQTANDAAPAADPPRPAPVAPITKTEAVPTATPVPQRSSVDTASDIGGPSIPTFNSDEVVSMLRRVGVLIVVASLALSFYVDVFVRPPAGGRRAGFLLVLAAISAAALHAFVLPDTTATCSTTSWWARGTDPIVWAMLVRFHAHATDWWRDSRSGSGEASSDGELAKRDVIVDVEKEGQTGGRLGGDAARQSGKRAALLSVRSVIVFCVRDLMPALAATAVVYLVATMVIVIAFRRVPLQYCD